ncbi:mpv17-like protein 2 [Cucurbita pepo subsp. pepo]|uniref:mpv17-like protein 2 n=1 Tax=Cucurbita pepo subsp. pepo TaxID=3664 RepID=UPI000C9D9FFE|nr:mpv17-like protein 2 [Cucurbita pepo subsp. pepo]
MAAINSFVSQRIPQFKKSPITLIDSSSSFRKEHQKTRPTKNLVRSIVRRRKWGVRSAIDDQELVRLEENRLKDGEQRLSLDGSEKIEASSSSLNEEKGAVEVLKGFSGRAVNATIVLGVGTLLVTRLLTIDHELWHGWTLYEVLRYAPEHNWIAYEEALKTNPVLAKMMISGIVYFLGDWIAQCYEGRPLFEFDRARMIRSGLVGFTLHGSLSHYYYQFCEVLFPFKDWWVVPVKVAFDQTVWSALWNSIYYVVLGILRAESMADVYSELKSTFWPMLTAGWKLWPFAHLITYGVIPVEQRLLWVDCVELIWVTILSTYSNEKSEGRISESSTGENEASSSSRPDKD